MCFFNVSSSARIPIVPRALRLKSSSIFVSNSRSALKTAFWPKSSSDAFDRYSTQEPISRLQRACAADPVGSGPVSRVQVGWGAYVVVPMWAWKVPCRTRAGAPVLAAFHGAALRPSTAAPWGASRGSLTHHVTEAPRTTPPITSGLVSSFRCMPTIA